MKAVEVSNVYERNLRAKARILVNRGGARSTKSWSIAQLLIQKFWNERGKKILVTRKTGPALHFTAYKLIVDLLSDYGFYPFLRHDKTYATIINPYNGSMFCFLSIDDPEKIKSTEWNYIWMEEANEFTWDDFIICLTRLSGPTIKSQPNHIFLSFNPTDETVWIETKLLANSSFARKCELIHSTYLDNPFLGDDYIEILEGLEDQDKNAHRIFALGLYGKLTHIIYEPYIQLNEFPAEMDETIYGLDFGFNNPSALIEIGIKDQLNAYLRQHLYQTHLTNSMLIDKLKELIPEENRHLPIYADSAEPGYIEEISQAGFNILSSDKEVKNGIDFCKRFKFYTLPENVDLNKERSVYKWRMDKNGNVLDEPVKFMDHILDAKRYAIYTHFRKQLKQPGLWVSDDEQTDDDD